MNPWDFSNTGPATNSQGYATSLAPQIQNAYTSMNQDTNQAFTNSQAASQNIWGLQQKQQGLQNMDQGGYPAMDNSYGLGAQPALNQALSTANKPAQNAGISNTSQGFNPWSMTGEANSR